MSRLVKRGIDQPCTKQLPPAARSYPSQPRGLNAATFRKNQGTMVSSVPRHSLVDLESTGCHLICLDEARIVRIDNYPSLAPKYQTSSTSSSGCTIRFSIRGATRNGGGSTPTEAFLKGTVDIATSGWGCLPGIKFHRMTSNQGLLWIEAQSVTILGMIGIVCTRRQ